MTASIELVAQSARDALASANLDDLQQFTCDVLFYLLLTAVSYATLKHYVYNTLFLRSRAFYRGKTSATYEYDPKTKRTTPGAMSYFQDFIEGLHARGTAPGGKMQNGMNL